MGYVAFPTFGRGQPWAQGADIRQMETPDLLAYLIAEAAALRDMAELLDELDAGRGLEEQLARLEARLEEFWDGERYAYRDRDTHLTPAAEELLYGGAGDEVHRIERALRMPARILVRVVGGVSQRPRMRLKLTGQTANGADYAIEAGADAFLWQNRQGVYTTEAPLARVDSIAFSGLSRVYKVYASAIDCGRLDINALLPLYSGRLPAERAAALVKLALDERHFLRPNGITMVSAEDRSFDASNARGGGGIWMYWLTLIGEGMLQAGYRAEATALVKRALSGLNGVLEREGKLSQFYHADEARGFGEDHHIGGIVPLKLLSDVIGMRIDAPDRVWVGGDFSWGEAVCVEQHGVTARRDAESIQIDFPSGHSVTLDAEAPWQMVDDPTALAPVDEPPEEEPAILLPSEAEAERHIIDVESGVAPADEGIDEEADSAPADDEDNDGGDENPPAS